MKVAQILAIIFSVFFSTAEICYAKLDCFGPGALSDEKVESALHIYLHGISKYYSFESRGFFLSTKLIETFKPNPISSTETTPLSSPVSSPPNSPRHSAISRPKLKFEGHIRNYNDLLKQMKTLLAQPKGQRTLLFSPFRQKRDHRLYKSYKLLKLLTRRLSDYLLPESQHDLFFGENVRFSLEILGRTLEFLDSKPFIAFNDVPEDDQLKSWQEILRSLRAQNTEISELLTIQEAPATSALTTISARLRHLSWLESLFSRQMKLFRGRSPLDSLEHHLLELLQLEAFENGGSIYRILKPGPMISGADLYLMTRAESTEPTDTGITTFIELAEKGQRQDNIRFIQDLLSAISGRFKPNDSLALKLEKIYIKYLNGEASEYPINISFDLNTEVDEVFLALNRSQKTNSDLRNVIRVLSKVFSQALQLIDDNQLVILWVRANRL